MSGLKTFLFLLSTLIIFSACVPTAKKTSCGPNERLDESKRACVPMSLEGADNHKPIGIAQLITVTEDVALNFSVLAATDIDADNLDYIVLSNPTKGTLTNCMNRAGSTDLQDRSCTYTPSLDLNGTDSFTYKVNDGIVDSDPITVTIEITAVADAPRVTPSIVTIPESAPYTFTFAYYDPEGDLAVSCNANNPVNLGLGACSCNAFGVCQIVVTPNLYKNSSNNLFSFTATVTSEITSTDTTISFFVTPVNDAPQITAAAGCTTNINQDSPFFCGTNPTFFDPDNGDAFPQTQTWSLAPSNTCAFADIDPSTGVVSGTPTDDHVGICDFVYQIKDNSADVLTDTTVSAPIAVTINNLTPILTQAGAITNPTEDDGIQPIGKVSSAAVCAEVFCLTVDTVGVGSVSVDNANSTCDDYGNFTVSVIDANNAQINFEPHANISLSAPCNFRVQFDDQNPSGNLAFVDTTMIIHEKNDTPIVTPASIDPQTTNTSTPFIVDADLSSVAPDPLIIDEGGGVSENSQTLKIKVSSSNTTLFPQNATYIKLFSDAALAAAYPVNTTDPTGITFYDADGDMTPIYLQLTPATGVTGTATITLTVSDDGTTAGLPAPADATPITFTVNVTNHSVAHQDWSDIYAVGARVLSDGAIETQPSVRLTWNPFTSLNDTPAGYWVYRSTNATGPFVTPLNATLLGETTFEDTSLTDADAGITYYYKVMAESMDNQLLLNPPQDYSVAKITIPLHNMALLHRRIVNLRTCETLGETTDSDNHNRCAYTGPGDNYSGYYDVGADYLVDRYETSCNFTVNTSVCTETGGVGCIGNDTPTTVGVTTGGDPAIYYDRKNGTCYYYSGSWRTIANLTKAQMTAFTELNQTIEGTSDIVVGSFPKKPPMVLIQQFKANNYCKDIPIPAAPNLAPAKTLISRQIHIAAAEWDPTLDDSNGSLGTLEAGANLSLTTSQCNATSGGDLDFQDSLISTLYDTWTATEAAAVSSHSFVMSGSTVTEEKCSSRYGIQDLVGNVEEWNLDRFMIYDNTTVSPIGANLGATINESRAPFMLNSAYNPYSYLDGTPNSENDAYIGNDVALTDFNLDEGFPGNINYIFLPLGLPTQNVVAASPPLASSFDLNDDRVYFFESPLSGSVVDDTIDDNELLGLTAGGKFDDGVGAGRYTLRFRTVCHDADNNGVCDGDDPISADGTEENVYTGFRCMMKLP